jgi:hypothetical protein
MVSLDGTMGPPLGFRAQQFVDAVVSLGDYDTLYTVLDSPGGSWLDAWIIHRFLTMAGGARRRSLVLITGECSGAAVLIALAFEHIAMRRGSYIQLQPVPLSETIGARLAQRYIASLIARRVEARLEEVLGWMNENKRFRAEECVELSISDGIL